MIFALISFHLTPETLHPGSRTATPCGSDIDQKICQEKTAAVDAVFIDRAETEWEAFEQIPPKLWSALGSLAMCVGRWQDPPFVSRCVPNQHSGQTHNFLLLRDVFSQPILAGVQLSLENQCLT